MKTFIITGFSKYITEDGKLYRKAYKTKDKRYKFQYREKRELKKTKKNKKASDENGLGFYLVKDKETKERFFICKRLRHRLKRIK